MHGQEQVSTTESRGEGTCKRAANCQMQHGLCFNSTTTAAKSHAVTVVRRRDSETVHGQRGWKNDGSNARSLPIRRLSRRDFDHIMAQPCAIGSCTQERDIILSPHKRPNINIGTRQVVSQAHHGRRSTSARDIAMGQQEMSVDMCDRGDSKHAVWPRFRHRRQPASHAGLLDRFWLSGS